ncbi:MAG: PEP-CTERM sorting domain-containing protein [Pseudomonadota bacterium]
MSIKTAPVVAAALLLSTTSQAAILRVNETEFLAGSGLIEFDEFPAFTTNPVYTPGDYGGGPGSPTVTFDGWFIGQSLSTDPGADCPGAAASACVVGTPTGPLMLDPSSQDTFIRGDGSNPTSPVLSGTPDFNGPIAVLFDTDVVGVGFDGGFFNDIASTAITAISRDGTILGSVENEGLGIEFLGLVTADGIESIAGVFLDLVGAESAGFAIDNLRFAGAGEVVAPTPPPPPGPPTPPPPTPVPEPSALALVGTGLAVLGLARRRRRGAP